MIGRRWLGCFVLVTGLIGLVGSRAFVQAGDDKAKWEWKAFDKNKDKKYDPFYQILSTKTNQTMKVADMEIKQEQNQQFYVKWTPSEPDKDGNWVVTQQIIGVKMDIDIGGNKITYDSTGQQPPKNPMSEFFDALQKAELKFYIKPADFSIVKIEGAEEFRKKLSTANPQNSKLHDNILSEASLKQMAEPTWQAFPTEKVRAEKEFKDKGTWKKTNTLDLGPIGIYDFTNTYTVGKDTKVTIESDVEYKVQTKDAKKEGLPFVIKSGKLKTKKGEGYAQFDKDRGRFKDSKLDMTLEGDLSIDIGGMVTDVRLTQTQNSTVVTQDENPLEKKKGQ